MTADGYFRTGDIAVMGEDGYLRIVDWKKDVILVSGFNVYPNEIEALVAKIPGVIECACVGVADPQSGEAVRLFVVRSDESLDGEQIRDYCRSHLAAYKVPKSVVGKILRRELRAL